MELGADPKTYLSLAQARRRQECRSLPWRLGLANVLSAGLHLVALSCGGRQPPIPEEVEFITFQWVEVPSEPPPEPQFVGPISAQEAGTSEPWDPSVSVRQSGEGGAGLWIPSSSQKPAAAQPVEASAFSQPQEEPDLKNLQQAVAAQNWAEALRLTEAWSERLSLSPQQRQQLQDYRQNLQHLLSASPRPDRTEPSPDPQPKTASSSATVLPQPPLPAPAVPPPPGQVAALSEKPPPVLSQTLPMGSANSNLGRASGVKSSRPGPPSLNALADPDWGDYWAQFEERVRQNWAVQGAARSYVTVVQVRLDRQGSLRELRLQTPSEDPLLDAAVLSAIRRSAPFAPLPKSYVGEELMLEIEVLSGSLEASLIGDPKN